MIAPKNIVIYSDGTIRRGNAPGAAMSNIF